MNNVCSTPLAAAAAVACTVVLMACSSGSESTIPTSTPHTTSTTQSAPTTPGLASSLAEAKARGYRFVDSISGESYADDVAMVDYFESDDCRATIDLLDQYVAYPDLGDGPWKWQCFENPTPTTSTPGP